MLVTSWRIKSPCPTVTGPGPVATILTSRVCPWQCVFCNENSYIPNMGRRPVDAVIDPIFGAFGVTVPASAWGTGAADALYLENDALMNGLADPNLSEALAYIRQLIADDLVDPEWPSNPGLRHQEKAFAGLAGVV